MVQVHLQQEVVAADLVDDLTRLIRRVEDVARHLADLAVLLHKSGDIAFTPVFRKERGRMNLYAVLDQVINLLRQHGRVAYRVLKLQFTLNDEAIEARKDELIYSQRLAVNGAIASKGLKRGSGRVLCRRWFGQRGNLGR